MDKLGYWDLTSSVNFCEENYQHNYYIAEPHNVWSSLFISLFALIGAYYGNPTNENRFLFIYGALFVTGIGSCALHATLSAIWQASDELPMLFVTLSLLYTIIELKCPKGTYSMKGLNYIFLIVAAFNTYIYFKYQQIYAVFLASYISSVAVVIWKSKVLLDDEDVKNDASTSLWYQSFFTYIVVGSLIWLLDMNACDFFLPYYRQMGGATLHIIWHIAAGLATYLLAQSLSAMRAKSIKMKTELEYVYGIIPVVRRMKEKALPSCINPESCNQS